MKQSLLAGSVSKVAVLLLFCGSAPALASVVTYTDRAAFLAALSGAPTTTETFSTNRVFGVGDNFYNGVNYRMTGTGVGGNIINFGVLQGDEFSPYSIEYVFPTSIFAIGADFLGARTATGLNWIIDGISTPVFDSAPGTGFFGIISTNAFTVVDVTSGPPANEIYSLDNLTFGGAAVVAIPEPASLTLVGVALLGAAVAARRRAV